MDGLESIEEERNTLLQKVAELEDIEVERHNLKQKRNQLQDELKRQRKQVAGLDAELRCLLDVEEENDRLKDRLQKMEEVTLQLSRKLSEFRAVPATVWHPYPVYYRY